MNYNEYQEEYAKINGIEEYLLHYQSKPEDPVLLFIHGGPGTSESAMAYIVETYEERNYNIVYYDQRGAGKTYLKNKKAKGTLKNLQEDLLQTVLYLKKKYKKDKIGIVGHSWGTVLGSLFAMEHPEHVLFYMGCGQLVDTRENERVGYAKLVAAIEQAGDEKDKKQLEKIGTYPEEGEFNKEFFRKMGQVRSLQGKYQLAVKADKGLIQMLRKSPVIGLRDLPTFLFGALLNVHLMNEVMGFNLYQHGSSYQVPVYYVLGENDQQTPVEMGEKYYETVEAPQKQLYIIKNAGHAPMVDNTKDYRRVLCEICNDN